MTTIAHETDLGAARLLRGLARRVALDQRRSLRGCGDIGLAQCHVLTALERHGETTLGELVHRIQLDKGWISRTVSRLEADGLLDRRSDENDGRCVRIRLTDAGAQAARRLSRALDQSAARLLEDLAPGDRAVVHESLRLLDEAAARRQDGD